jgi:hypothetical protein
MNDTDLDIILALADDQLTGEAKQAALERIAADPELGEELAAQVAAMDELRSLEPALMTSSERAALRSALVEQLNLQPAAPVVTTPSQTRPWWVPVLGLASAAALLLAIVAVPSIFSGSDDSPAEFVAIAPEATTPVDSAEELGDSGDESALAKDEVGEASLSTVVVPQIDEKDVQEFFNASPPSVDTTVSTSRGDVDDSAGVAEASPDTTFESIERVSPTDPIAIDAAQLEECLKLLGDSLPEGEYVPRAATLDDEATIVHFGIDASDGVVHSVSVDLETCVITSQIP